jgi:hypothetical protein
MILHHGSQSACQIFVLANEFKEGDLNVGGTRDDQIRREGREALSFCRSEILLLF